MSFLHVKLPVLCNIYQQSTTQICTLECILDETTKFTSLLWHVSWATTFCVRKSHFVMCRISLITSLELRSNRSNCGSGFLFVGIQMLHIRSYMGSCTSDFLERVKRNLDQENKKILETFKRQLLENDEVFCNLDDTWDEVLITARTSFSISGLSCMISHVLRRALCWVRAIYGDQAFQSLLVLQELLTRLLNLAALAGGALSSLSFGWSICLLLSQARRISCTPTLDTALTMALLLMYKAASSSAADSTVMWSLFEAVLVVRSDEYMRSGEISDSRNLQREDQLVQLEQDGSI